MGKDGKDGEKRKSLGGTKEVQPRRSSTMNLARRGSVLESVAEGPSKRQSTPDSTSKTITQARRSSSSMQMQRGTRSSVDETGMKIAGASPKDPTPTVPRSTSILRPRNTAAAASSALPKYRPRSVAEQAPLKPSSPPRAGTRRKHDSSEEERDPNATCAFVMHTPMDKGNRPISPIPRRASKLVRSPPTTTLSNSPAKAIGRSQTSPFLASAASSPARPKKAAKGSTSPVNTKSGLPRLTESVRSTPQTPRTSTMTKLVTSRLDTSGRGSPSSLRMRDLAASPSPASRKAVGSNVLGKSLSQSTATTDRANDSPGSLVEGMSADSLEAGDVELMLAAIASPTAPTPAIPRLGSRMFAERPPETPTRSSSHGSQRSSLALSLYPPSPDVGNLSTVDEAQEEHSSGKKNMRSSIAAWEKLADLSVSLEASDVGGLLSEVSAPFFPMTPGLLSPSPSGMQLDPESPTPSTLPSPGGYASISQMLLPTVTPAPVLLRSRESPALDVHQLDSATATLLRLQLASMENLAKERLAQIHLLEDQLHASRESRRRDESELTEQVLQLEDRLKASLSSPSRESVNSMTTGDHSACRAALEERIWHAEAAQQQAVEEAVSRWNAEHIADRTRVHQSAALSAAARDAEHSWKHVLATAEGALEIIHSNRETLTVLLSNLDLWESQLSCSPCA